MNKSGNTYFMSFHDIQFLKGKKANMTQKTSTCTNTKFTICSHITVIETRVPVIACRYVSKEANALGNIDNHQAKY